jgi:hypothetical protein
MVTSNRTPAQDWEAHQKSLDAESAEIAREFDEQKLQRRVGALTPERQRVHAEFQHDPKRCRCFEIEGV